MITRPRGCQDILPGEVEYWQRIETYLRKICALYNYKEIRTPIFESGNLFHRNQSDSSDMVTKETYDFKDRGDRDLTLRPEGTAGAARAYIENKLYVDNPVTKLYYMGPIFRYERPSQGRQRQFHQFGIEAYGSNDPLLDAEVIALACSAIKGLGLTGVKVKINTLGDEESRKRYKDVLVEYFSKYQDDLCEDCKNRLIKNPLRILDCKVDHDKDYFKKAPLITDYLSEESKEHFNKVIASLEDMGIDYEIDPTLVRGLDYYTYTVFEIVANIKDFGAANTICAGGRYNNLVSELEGPQTPAVGLAFGMERLILALQSEEKLPNVNKSSHIYFIALGDKARKETLKIMNDCRYNGLICDMDFNGGSLKSQFKKADKNNALFTVIMGDNELENKVVNIKNNETDTQETIDINSVYEYVVKYVQSKTKCHGCSK
jgi:histidyl-tRNA synthetase